MTIPELDLEGLLATVADPQPQEVARLLGEGMLVGLVSSPQESDGGPDFPVLREAGLDHGLDFQPVVWSDPGVNWQSFDVLLPLCVSDYTIRASSFRHWLAERVKRGSFILNSENLLRWGMNKGYLLELQEMGMPMARTELRLSGSRLPGDWPEGSVLVIRPRSGSGGLGVELLPLSAWRPPGQDIIVQEYDPEITNHGEVSVVFIDGKPFGQVRRLPASDDFRVGDIWGGGFRVEPLSESALSLAHRILSALPEVPFYARVDLWDWREPHLLAEVELVDPDLFLRALPGAADCLASALKVRLSERSG